MNQVYEQTGIMPPELKNYPEMPHAVSYLWYWFIELHMARGYSEIGPQVISYRDIEAWCRITGREPNPAEVEAIKALDHLYLRITNGGH